jgi:hypothetical protein
MQFTARELFYSAASEAPQAAKDAPKPAAPPAKKAAAPKKPPVPPPAQTTAAAPPSAPAPPPAPQPASQPTQPVALPGGATVIRASLSTAPAPATGTPLGLKYTILKKSGDDMVEVPPDTVFHNGDHMQFSVQTNGPGYLYVITQGSSGTWTPLFPSPEVADGNNHVDGWSANILPSPKYQWTFHEPTGPEKIFIVFSRTPEAGLENMIYSLQDRKAKPAAAHPEESAPPGKAMQFAMADIDNATVGRLRDTYTRDLIIEKVDEKTPGDKSPEKKENAVYVVNPSGSADSRVVADLILVHQ